MFKSKMLYVVVAALLTACGGGSGGGEPNTDAIEIDTTRGAQFITFAYDSAMNAVSAANAATASTRAFAKPASNTLLSQNVAGVLSGFQRGRARARAFRAPRAAPVSNCADGGSENYSNTSSDTGPTSTTTYSNCKWSYDSDNDGQPDMQVTQNGTTITKTRSTGFELRQGDATTPYTYTITRIADGRVMSEDVLDNVLSVSFGAETYTCGGRTRPSAFTVTVSGTDHQKVDQDRDGAWDIDIAESKTDFVTEAKIESFDSATCLPNKLALSVVGKSARVDNLKADQTLTMEASADNPITLVVEDTQRNGAAGQLITVNGSPTMTTPCSTAKVTVTTLAPIFLAATEACATEGAVRITGAKSTSIAFTSTGGVNIDTGDDGSIDESFPSCSSASICR